MSKKCSVCDGARSIKQKNKEQYEEIINNHNCQINFKGSADMSRTKSFSSFEKLLSYCCLLGAMEVDGIYRLFSRSVMLYNVQYVK